MRRVLAKAKKRGIKSRESRTQGIYRFRKRKRLRSHVSSEWDTW
jgi:hypothetical protein